MLSVSSPERSAGSLEITVTLHLYFFPANFAMIVVLPLFFARTTPFLPTLAMLLSFDFHVTLPSACRSTSFFFCPTFNFKVFLDSFAGFTGCCIWLISSACASTVQNVCTGNASVRIKNSARERFLHVSHGYPPLSSFRIFVILISFVSVRRTHILYHKLLYFNIEKYIENGNLISFSSRRSL